MEARKSFNPLPPGPRAFSFLSEDAVGRPLQAQVLAQGRAFVFAPEEAAPLQFGRDLPHEVIEAVRPVGVPTKDGPPWPPTRCASWPLAQPFRGLQSAPSRVQERLKQRQKNSFDCRGCKSIGFI